MSQPTPTPAWGTPVGTPVPPTGVSTGTSPAAETQVMPPVGGGASIPSPALPTRAQVELRSTALYYATRVLGDQGTASPDARLSTTLRVARGLEKYLLTGSE